MSGCNARQDHPRALSGQDVGSSPMPFLGYVNTMMLCCLITAISCLLVWPFTNSFASLLAFAIMYGVTGELLWWLYEPVHHGHHIGEWGFWGMNLIPKSRNAPEMNLKLNTETYRLQDSNTLCYKLPPVRQLLVNNSTALICFKLPSLPLLTTFSPSTLLDASRNAYIPAICLRV
ncbi:hypothetical protein BC938DRAFT_479887 [Jimgerdemannia flammicorona]|uniref:Uncharacterized protein n=1 Tax=Jimgerdemannia flammicorona TaxID=994334 RepID=A0A433QJV7_9FUNG|nr:hypothetical protein BC938DRAFT_479887 [Jimgerdemannia flammicorona]